MMLPFRSWLTMATSADSTSAARWEAGARRFAIDIGTALYRTRHRRLTCARRQRATRCARFRTLLSSHDREHSPEQRTSFSANGAHALFDLLWKERVAP